MACAAIYSSSVRAVEGGENTGPNPTDRAKSESKHHVIVEANGIPVGAMWTGANRHDVTQLLMLVDGIEPVAGKRGRPRKRPNELYDDLAYDSEAHRQALQKRGIIPHLARRDTEYASGMGGHCWASERTLGWQHGYRRLRVRFDRADEIHEAFLELAQSIICFRKLNKIFC